MVREGHDARGDEAKAANAILVCLERESPLSRAAIAKRLGLSRTTLSTLVSRFIDQGLVREIESEDPQGRGRPGIPVALDDSTWFALGAEFNSLRWSFVLANLKGEVAATRTMAAACTPDEFLSVLIAGIRHMREKVPGRLLPAVGIGVPGLVNWETGDIIRADDLGWVDVRVGREVERAAGLAAYVLNRNRATGLAEARFGQGRNVDNFVYIGIGTGISAAIMLDGDLLHGHDYGAGEIGHVVVDAGGPLCRCGKRGCLQTLAAGGALVERARSLPGHGGSALKEALSRGEALAGEDVCRFAMNGDPVAREAVRIAASYIATAIGNLVAVINPEKFILGGPLVRVGPLLANYVRGEAERNGMARPHVDAAIEASRLDEYAGALGAACLVLRNKLELSAGASPVL